MNFTIKKMFCATLCGVLFLTALPAQAFSFNFDYVKSWFTPKMAIATAAVAAAGLLVWKYFGSKKPKTTSVKLVEIHTKEDLKKLEDGMMCIVKNEEVIPVGTYKVIIDVRDNAVFYWFTNMSNQKSYSLVINNENQQATPQDPFELKYSSQPTSGTSESQQVWHVPNNLNCSNDLTQLESEEADEHYSFGSLLGSPEQPSAAQASASIVTPPRFNTSLNQSFGVHGGSQTWSMPAKPTEIKQLVMLPRVTSLEKDHVFNLEEGLVPQCIITPGLYGIIDIAPNGENQKTYTLIKIENNVLSVINAASSPEIVVTFTRIKDNNNEWSGWQIKGLCEKNNSGTQKTISVSPSAMPAQSNSLVTSLDQPLASSDSSATLPDNAMKIDDLYTLAKINPLEKGTVFNLTRTVIYLLVMTDSGTEGCHEMLESGLHEITNIIDEYSAGQLVKRTLNITNIKNYQAFEIVFKRPLNYNWIPGEWDMILCKDARTFNGPFQQDPRNPHSK